MINYIEVKLNRGYFISNFLGKRIFDRDTEPKLKSLVETRMSPYVMEMFLWILDFFRYEERVNRKIKSIESKQGAIFSMRSSFFGETLWKKMN